MKHLYFIFLLTLFSCFVKPIHKPTDQIKHLAQNKVIYSHIIQKGKNGDWLVIRGYHFSDNLVSNASAMPISHVAILDKDSLRVIEADASGIHTTSLEKFVDKSHRLIIIRPRWHSEESSKYALEKAYSLIGKKYDFLGTIGIDIPSRYYCSELAVFTYKKFINKNITIPKIIKPSELYLYGQILYDSFPRDEMESPL